MHFPIICGQKGSNNITSTIKFYYFLIPVNNNTRCSIARLTYIIKLDNEDDMYSISSTVPWWHDNFASDIAQLWCRYYIMK